MTSARIHESALPSAPVDTLTVADLVAAAHGALALDRLLDDPAGGAAVVDARSDPAAPAPEGLDEALRSVPLALVAITGTEEPPPAGTLAAAVDVAVPDDAAAAEVVDAVADRPVAAAALALLLRAGERRTIAEGLLAESATYSVLQAGPEHGAWLEQHRRRHVEQNGPAVRVERDGGRLLLTLSRPKVHNAFDARMREELLAGLLVAAADATVGEVVLRGDGASFCSGGDLGEFGTRADPASAHLLRVARSAGRALAAVADRTTAEVHGACIGAGVELPAFAHRVVAAPDATFRLPEVAMGLVPGAGGTVSIPRRIGRQRAAWLALTGRSIDATTALRWGLVDEVRSGG